MIKSLKEIQELQGLANLGHLDITGNPICELNNYIDKVFQILPNLDILDGQDQEGNEI